MTTHIENLNIASCKRMVTPEVLHQQYPVEPALAKQISNHRRSLQAILNGQDKRIFVVVGPCSIHDPQAAMEYAVKLQQLQQELSEHLFIIMRVYFEKPRTTIGWKGLINDPNLNDSFDIEKGLGVARELLIKINSLGLPVGTEALDPISPQYIQDLISWSAVGARTTESQTHREMASGLSCPVGFKNTTSGALDVVTHAMQSVSCPHHFLGIDAAGHISVIKTKGNPYGHAILRGGKKPNYDTTSIEQAEQSLLQAGVANNIVVDCSHANSSKDHNKQADVLKDVGRQIQQGNQSIIGMMLESNLVAGNQKISDNMTYGQSITDACIDWQTTESILTEFVSAIKDNLQQRRSAEWIQDNFIKT